MTAPADLPIIAVVGPTATGKSGLGLDLAARLDGEIINADAMQLYRGMDIGTAKLNREQRRGIPHHQLDVLEVTEEASVAAYQEAARADIRAIRERDRVPILVGGSGLYVRAVLDRLTSARWPCFAWASRRTRSRWVPTPCIAFCSRGTRQLRRGSNPETSGASSALLRSSS